MAPQRVHILTIIKTTIYSESDIPCHGNSPGGEDRGNSCRTFRAGGHPAIRAQQPGEFHYGNGDA